MLHHYTMDTLLSLPNELLDRIINDVHIDDIEAFSSCCKEVKLLAAVRHGKHLARKFNFPTIAIEPMNGPEDHSSEDSDDTRVQLIPTSLLRDFLMDEENTLYPRSMFIGNVITIRDDEEEMRSALVTTYLQQHRGLEDKIVAKVMQIQKTLYPEKPALEAQDWIDLITKGNSDATASLLVTLFPNVKTLSMLHRHTDPERLLVRTLERLTSAAAKDGPRALDAFRELSEVNIRAVSYRGDADGKLIAVFMILPSMRVIKGYRLRWSADDWSSEPVTSSVKEISLECSQIHSNPFISCLKRIETLQRFTYDLLCTRGSTILWEPRLIVKALRKYAWRTLVHLELTGEARSLSADPADGEPFIGTLRSFQVLESIRLMSMMLFKPIDGEDIDESEDIIRNTSENFVGPTSLVEPRRLVDFLPSSARKLQLVGGLSNKEARDMFADLPELKRERLPNLFDIVLEDSDPLEQETKGLCKNAGIRLKSIKRVVNGYQRIYAITKPVSQVDPLER